MIWGSHFTLFEKPTPKIFKIKDKSRISNKNIKIFDKYYLNKS